MPRSAILYGGKYISQIRSSQFFWLFILGVEFVACSYKKKILLPGLDSLTIRNLRAYAIIVRKGVTHLAQASSDDLLVISPSIGLGRLSQSSAS